MMLDFGTAATVASILVSLPLLILGRTVYFAMVSATRFVATSGVIQSHVQPKSEDGEPLQLCLEYRYAVDGESHIGRRYYFGSKHDCNPELLKQFPPGSECVVFYDPKCPKRSTLQVGFHSRLWFWIVTVALICPILWIAVVAGLVTEWKVVANAIGMTF